LHEESLKMESLLAALLLGVVSGLRSFTAIAVLWLVRHPGPVAYGLGVLGLLEYAGDLYPNTPARTSSTGLIARLLVGAFCGWVVTATVGSPPIAGALLGALGALVGAFGGLAARLRGITLVGRVPAALIEDAIAVAGAVAIVLKLT
jgi:uncharacterized membrane protein